MTNDTLAALVPVLVFLVSAAGVASPLVMRHLPALWGPTFAVIGLLGVSLASPEAAWAFGAMALGGLVHAWTALRHSRTGGTWLLIAAMLLGATATAIALDAPRVAFLASIGAIAVRGGAMPVHMGTSALVSRVPAVLTQQLATLIAIVFLHLRFVDHHPIAVDAGPWIVRTGAAITLLPALLALRQRTLDGLVRNAVAMHGGMLVASVGAAGHGHYAAALLVAITHGIAVGGFVLVAQAAELRTGPLDLRGLGGRARAFPGLAMAFALLGASGVGMPGTAGFIADDLLLHALWQDSAGATAAIIMASACLAISILLAFTGVFLGPQRSTFAPDLMGRERAVVVVLVLVLVSLGIVPELVLGPAEALLGS